MDKITKISKENTKQSRKRFAIIPLKKHLAKFLIVDWDRIYPLVPKEEIEDFFQKENQARKYGLPHLPRLISDESARERQIIPFLKFDATGFFNEEPMFKDPSEVKIQYYTNRRNLSFDFIPFVEKGYTLMKFTVPVRKVNKYGKNQEIKSRNFPFLVKFANEMLECYFADYVRDKINFSKKIDLAITEIYSILKLTSEDIKKDTLKRSYHRHKNDVRHHLDLFEKDHIHKKICDKELFEIYQEHFENKVSYLTLSSKYKLSKTTIVRVCNNPKVMDLYNKVIRYHNSHINWFLDN